MVINPLEIVGLVVSPVKPLDAGNIRFWIHIKILLRCMAKTNFCWWNSSLHWDMTFNYTWTVGKPGIGMRPPPVSVDVVVVAILRKWKWEKQNDKHAKYQSNILFIIDNININDEWKKDRKCQTSVTAPIQKRFPHGTPALQSSIDKKHITSYCIWRWIH